MSKTSRTFCAHSVKMYFTKKGCMHHRMKRNKNKKPCKDNHEALPVERKRSFRLFCFTTDFIAF